MMKETSEEDVIEGYDFNNGVNHSEVINFMGSTGFQASHLGDAIHIVNHM
ncbi:deoxyhypusine synthase, partial [Tanacetum coccineum]